MSTERGLVLTRRQALLLAASGAVSSAVGVTGLLRDWGSPASGLQGRGFSERGRTGAALVEPEMIASTGGGLHVTLTAVAGAVDLVGRSIEALSYNGSVPGPTLKLRPGDRVTLDLENRLGTDTNLHMHGLHVSPAGNSDNPFVHVQDGETFRYEYEIPRHHPAGTFWYHPHLHGRVADQLFGGLVGAVVIDRDDAVALPTERERMLLITDTALDGNRIARVGMPARMLGREGDLVLVNGQLEPTIRVSPGSFEHWRVVNGCCSRFMRLRLQDGQLIQVAGDIGSLAEPTPTGEVFMAPGNRVQLLARVPRAGAYRLVAERVERGSAGMGGMMDGGAVSDRTVTLLRLEASGAAVTTPRLPGQLARLDDLRGSTVDARRTLTFTTGMAMGRGMTFAIDGKEFDPNRVDTPVRLGAVEEWTIANAGPMDHPFHLHVWPMQVTSRGGVPVRGSPQWQDVVNVPARSSVTVRLRLTDFPGRTVYHCHILDHEDLGMMGVIDATA